MNKTQIPTSTNNELLPWFIFIMIRKVVRMILYDPNVKN